MELYVIRHGESETNELGLHSGWANVQLTPLGHEQAKMSGRHLSHIRFDIVYVSDLVRARQTAENALPGYTLNFTDKLREISVGSLSYQSPEACLDKYGELYKIAKSKHDYRDFGGESTEDMMERITAFMHELESLHGADNVAAVAHEGTAHCILSYTLGYDIPRKSIKLGNGAVSRFSYKNGIWKLNTWNYIGTI